MNHKQLMFDKNYTQTSFKKRTWDWDNVKETTIENREWLQILLRPFKETSSFNIMD